MLKFQYNLENQLKLLQFEFFILGSIYRALTPPHPPLLWKREYVKGTKNQKDSFFNNQPTKIRWDMEREKKKGNLSAEKHLAVFVLTLTNGFYKRKL